MRRRDVLRGAVGLVGTAGVTTVTGRSTNVRTGYEPYGPLGRVGVDGATEAVVGGDGATVYVAATTGFATVDVSDPTDPTVLTERRDLLADREDGPMTGIHDVKVEGDRLLVAGPADHGRSEVTGVLVYDVADPAAPRQVSFLPTSDHVHNCFLHGGIAYYPQGSANQRLEVADVSGEDPTPVATWDPTVHDATWTDVDGSHRTVHDVWVQDGRAYLATWDAGTFVLDVADPRDPSFLARVGGRPMDELRDPARGSRIQPPGNHHYVQVSEDGSLLVIGVESWNVENEAGGGPGGVHLWDISSLTDPRQRSTVEPHRARDETYSSGTWTTSHNFELSGGRLYTSWYQGGVRIHDVSDPEAPEQLAAWRDHREAAFWTARTAGEDVFVASSTAATRALSGLYEGLYTFPDRAGEQADPPAIPSPTPSATPTASPTGGDTPTPTPTPTETPSPTPLPTPTPNPVVGDGFGPLAGLAAVLGAAWWRRRD